MATLPSLPGLRLKRKSRHFYHATPAPDRTPIVGPLPRRRPYPNVRPVKKGRHFYKWPKSSSPHTWDPAKHPRDWMGKFRRG